MLPIDRSRFAFTSILTLHPTDRCDVVSAAIVYCLSGVEQNEMDTLETKLLDDAKRGATGQALARSPAGGEDFPFFPFCSVCLCVCVSVSVMTIYALPLTHNTHTCSLALTPAAAHFLLLLLLLSSFLSVSLSQDRRVVVRLAAGGACHRISPTLSSPREVTPR